MRKVLSFVLVLALVLGSFSMAFAATPTDVAGTDYSEAVTVLSGLGVVAGYPDGTYKPAQAVTRAEMAKLIVVALGLEDYAVGTSKFPDMAGATWAQGYVNYASGLGVILGYPDGTFKPSQTVSYDEAVAMIVRALGYTDASLLPATWPANYVVKAKALGILADVNAKAGGADRGDVAIMLYNTLPLSFGAISNDTGKWVANAGTDNMLTRLGATAATVTVAPGDVGDADVSIVDLTPYVYATLHVYKNSDGVIVSVASVHSDEVTGAISQVAVVANTVVTLADDTDVTLAGLTSQTAVYFNGGATVYDSVDTEFIDGYDVTVYGTLNASDDTIVSTVAGIVAWAPTDIALVTANDVTSISDAITDGNGTVLGIELSSVDNKGEALDLAKISVVGAATKLADIQENDVVYVYASANDTTKAKVKFEVVRNAKDIKISKITSTKVYAGTTAYEFPTLNIEANQVHTTDFVLDNTYTVYLGNDGKILFNEYVSGTTNLYGVVVATDAAFSFGTTTTSVKILTSNDEKVIYEVDTDVVTTLSSIAARSLVEYALDSDGIVTGIKGGATITTSTTYDARTNVLSGKFVAADVVVFDTSAIAAADAKLSAIADDNVLAGKYILNSDGEIAAIAFTSNSGGASSNKYFAVNTISNVLNGTATVFQFDGFKGAVAATPMTNFHTVVTLTSAPAVWAVTYSGIDISSVAAISTTARTVDTASSTVVDTTTGSGVSLVGVDADVLVYVEVYDADGLLDSYTVGSMSDVTYKDVIKYVTDATSGEITLIILTQRADVTVWPSNPS